jgi:hypothetical protein
MWAYSGQGREALDTRGGQKFWSAAEMNNAISLPEFELGLYSTAVKLHPHVHYSTLH